MLINVSGPVTKINGDIIPADKEGTPLTVRNVIVNALVALQEGDKAEEKLDKFFLARKIQQANSEVDLTAEDIVLIKKTVGPLYSPEAVGAVWEILT